MTTTTLSTSVRRRATRQHRSVVEARLRRIVPHLLREVNGAVTRADLKAAANGAPLHHAHARITQTLDQWQDRLVTAMARPIEKAERAAVEPTVYLQRGIWRRPPAPNEAWRAAVAKAEGDEPPVVNHELIARHHIAELVRHLNDSQRRTVQEQLTQLMRWGVTPERLDAIGDATGLTPRQAAHVGRIYELQVKNGASEAMAQRVARNVQERLIAYRAKVIARTEATRFTNAVVQNRGEQLDLQGTRMVKQWVSARDDRVDEICSDLDNGEAIPVGEAFASIEGPLLYPPAHPMCRCLLDIFTAEDA